VISGEEDKGGVAGAGSIRYAEGRDEGEKHKHVTLTLRNTSK